MHAVWSTTYTLNPFSQATLIVSLHRVEATVVAFLVLHGVTNGLAKRNVEIQCVRCTLAVTRAYSKPVPQECVSV